MKDDLKCPYCGHQQEVCHDDGFGYEEGKSHEVECHKCEKHYQFTTTIILMYESHKADCLNTDNHDYQQQIGDDRYLRCSICDGRIHKIANEDIMKDGLSEREFVRQFTAGYAMLLNDLELAERYKEPLDAKKILIVDSYEKVLKPLCESYFNERFLPEIIISHKTALDMQHTTTTMFGWLHWYLKGDVKKAVQSLLFTLIKAV